ncbi:MAG: membrane protein insertase YidC [Thermoanaerobaculia bacterium]
MEKRLFLAVFLSIAFLFGWGALAPRIFPGLRQAPPETATVTAGTDTVAPAPGPAQTAPPESPAMPAPTAAQAAPAVAPVAAGRIEVPQVDSPKWRARFTNRGAQLVSFTLLDYPEKPGEGPVDLVAPRSEQSSDYPFAIVSSDARLNRLINESLYEVQRSTGRDGTVLRFRWAGEGVSVEKTFKLHPESYLFDFEVRVTPATIPFRVVIGPGLRRILPDEEYSKFMTTGAGVVQYADDLETINREKSGGFRAYEGMPQFAGLQDNYFLAVMLPRQGSAATFRETTVPPITEGGDPRKELYVGINAQNGVVAGEAYFGPKEVATLDAAGLGETLQFGIFGFISRLLLVALIWFNTFTHNFGWAIVVLTFFIKLALYPLQHKSMVSMKKMQAVQPKANAIKDRYRKAKTDPEQRQKMNLEMMKLYKDEGINPASGCVPLLLQLPILWGFYTLLSRAIELRGEPWILWIHDLSVKDPYYITPILMTVTMFLQQWLTPTTVDPVQRKVFLAMPVVFGWLFKEFPSGLVLYWLVQNILSIIQQLITNRYWSSHPAAEKKGA